MHCDVDLALEQRCFELADERPAGVAAKHTQFRSSVLVAARDDHPLSKRHRLIRSSELLDYFSQLDTGQSATAGTDPQLARGPWPRHLFVARRPRRAWAKLTSRSPK